MAIVIDACDMDNMEVVLPRLVKIAQDALRFSYSPYSKFRVGAALLSVDGQVFTGCNIENAAYSPCICAERTAFVKALSEGVRRFKAIGVVCESAPGSWPCGVCRQFMSEFGGDLIVVAGGGPDGKFETSTIAELLPHMFQLNVG